MNHFLEHLPWRIAALAGLLVGVISLAEGANLWISLIRVGAAFFLFGLLGLGLSAILKQGGGLSPTSNLRGRHFDQTTPPDVPEETANPASSSVNDVK